MSADGVPAEVVHSRRHPGVSRYEIWLSAFLIASGLYRRSVHPYLLEGDQTIVEDGRRQRANLPAVGWTDILLRVYNGISEDRVLANAAGVTYYALLALFPGIAAVVSIYGLFADPNSIVSHVDTMAGFAPGGAIDVIRDQLTRLSAQGSTELGVSFLIGLVISLWSANSGIKALFDSLNVVYEEEEKRTFIRLNAVTLTFTIATIVFLLIALACVVAFPVMLTPFCCGRHRSASKYRPMADSVGAGGGRADADLPIRPEPYRAAVAMDHLGWRPCCRHMAWCFRPVLVVRSKFRQLQ